MKGKLLALIFAIAFLPIFIFGQTGIQASPYRIEENVEPGDTVSTAVRVTNTTHDERTFYADLMDFTVVGEGGNARLMRATEDREYSLTDWVQINKSGMNFGPREYRDVQVVVRIPEDIGPGGYYGAIVFGPNPPTRNDEDGTFVGMSHRVGVLMLFNVIGDADVEARIREFSTGRDLYDTPYQVDFLTRVENIGNLHIKPVGSIQIENMRGTKVASIPLNQAGDNALPQSIRRFENMWEEDFGFGRYKASLVMNFGDPPRKGGMGVRTITDETTFWIIPKTLVAQVTGFLLLVIFIIYFIFKRSQQKTIEEIMNQTGLERKEAIKKKNASGFGLAVAILVLSLLAIGIYIYFFVT